MEIKQPRAAGLEPPHEEHQTHTETPPLRGGECHRETVHRFPKMAGTHALMNVTLSPVSTTAEASGRREGALFAATTDQWDHHQFSFAVQHAGFSATAMPD
ncbi:hypothetical protein TcG_10305 [Trypanosoma cruzi]|nr:hypothetical protein TcG_10305 [Trypanosoma cruzi]